MNSKEARDIKNTAISTVAQALTSDVRLNLMNLLLQCEDSVDHLAKKVDQSLANTSAQLKVLLGANLLKVRKDGRKVIYRVANPSVPLLMEVLQETAATNMADMRELKSTFFHMPEQLPSKDAVLKQVKQGAATLWDVRPADEFEANHLNGAVNVPFTEVSERMATLDKSKPVYVYCRGRYCVFAPEVVKTLKANGVDAINLFYGVSESGK